MEDFDPETVRALRLEGKAHLRKRARAVRKALPQAAVTNASRVIVARLLSLVEAESAKRVALFDPIVDRKEVDLRPLATALAERGIAVCYPAIDAATREMTFRSGELADRGFGFREPAPDAPIVQEVDVVVVPALLLDPRGHRIGYGGGFYDRTLPRFCPPATSVGVGFHFQLAPEIPNLEWDVPLDIVVTEETVLDLRQGSRPGPPQSDGMS